MANGTDHGYGDSISQADFARQLGVSKNAVSKAVKSGRLAKSLVWFAGVARIGDVAAAQLEWKDNRSRVRADIPEAKPVAVVPAPSPEPRAAAAPNEPPAAPKGRKKANTLAEASTREKNAKADLAELEFQEKTGALVPAKVVESAWDDILTRVRTGILAVPSKVKAELPHLTHTDLAVINSQLLQTLEALAAQEPGAAA